MKRGLLIIVCNVHGGFVFEQEFNWFDSVLRNGCKQRGTPGVVLDIDRNARLQNHLQALNLSRKRGRMEEGSSIRAFQVFFGPFFQ